MSLFREEVLESRRDRLHGQIVLTQPLSANILVGALFLIIFAAAVWVTLGSYARVETVPGILITDIPSAKVIAPQNGIVTDLLVVEGQKVEKGDGLLVINSDRQAASGGHVVDRGLGVIEARRQLSQTQLALADNRATAERRRLAAVISSAEQQTASLRAQIALQEEVVASNQMIFDQIAKVVDRGFVSKVEYERRRQTLLNSQQSLAGLHQQLTASAATAQDARSQLASVTIETAQGISQIQDGLQTLSAEEARLQGEQSYVVVAPISGRVTALATGLGRPATPGRPLLIGAYALTGFAESAGAAIESATPDKIVIGIDDNLTVTHIEVDPRNGDVYIPEFGFRVGAFGSTYDPYPSIPEERAPEGSERVR